MNSGIHYEDNRKHRHERRGHRRNAMKRLLMCLTALLLLAAVGCTHEVPSGQLTEDGLHVFFLDVGQADCTLILSDGHAMLIDGGNTDDGAFIVSFLKEKGVTALDYVVATHAHEDHVGGLTQVLKNFPCKTVYAPVLQADNAAFTRFARQSEQQGGLTQCLRGTRGDLGQAHFEVLFPFEPEKEENVNNTSVVLRLTLGQASFLFVGDLERDAESRLLSFDDDLTSAVLKVGHHGSSTSTSYYFLRRVLPQTAVISCGANNEYGHPHKETIDILNQAEIDIWRTDTMGTVEAVTDGTLLTVRAGELVKTAAVLSPTPALDIYYIGNKKSRVFHLPACASLPKENNRVDFSSREEAISAGYTPCSRCRP